MTPPQGSPNLTSVQVTLIFDLMWNGMFHPLLLWTKCANLQQNLHINFQNIMFTRLAMDKQMNRWANGQVENITNKVKVTWTEVRLVDICLHYVCWTWRLRSIPLTTINLPFVSSDSSVYAVSYSSGYDRICLTDLTKSSTATIRHQQFTSRARYHNVRYLASISSSRTQQILPM